MPEAIREGFIADKPVPASRQQLRAAEPASPPAPVEPQDAWPVVIKLKYGTIRVDVHHPEISEVSLRHPTAGDINYCGSPVVMGPQGIFVIEERKMSAMISRLSGILPPVLDQMDARDWASISYRLLRFFLPSLAEAD